MKRVQHMIRRLWLVGLVCGLTAASPTWAGEKIYIVTSLPDLADLARQIGGDAVTAEALATGVENHHAVPIKPSMVVKLNRADLVILMGMEYEHAFLPALLGEARNPKILKGSPGYIDCSVHVTPKEVPENLSRVEGDVHPLGSPHFNLDPEGGRAIAQAIYEGLVLNYPALKPKFEANYNAFLAKLDEKEKEWAVLARPLKGLKFVSYHRAWAYFADSFGMISVGEIELKPGIEPTATHIVDLLGQMKAVGVKVVFREPEYPETVPDQIAAQVGGVVVKMPLMAGGVPEVKTWFELIEYDIRAVLKAAQEAGVIGKV